MMLSALVLLLSLQAQPSKPSVEMVDPQAYAIKRFQEVVHANEESEPTTIQEKLIATRARMAVSERQVDDLKQRMNSSDESKPKPQTLKAAQAKLDHYRKVVAQLENKILREKRNERGQIEKKEQMTQKRKLKSRK